MCLLRVFTTCGSDSFKWLKNQDCFSVKSILWTCRDAESTLQMEELQEGTHLSSNGCIVIALASVTRHWWLSFVTVCSQTEILPPSNSGLQNGKQQTQQNGFSSLNTSSKCLVWSGYAYRKGKCTLDICVFFFFFLENTVQYRQGLYSLYIAQPACNPLMVWIEPDCQNEGGSFKMTMYFINVWLYFIFPYF